MEKILHTSDVPYVVPRVIVLPEDAREIRVIYKRLQREPTTNSR